MEFLSALPFFCNARLAFDYFRSLSRDLILPADAFLSKQSCNVGAFVGHFSTTTVVWLDRFVNFLLFVCNKSTVLLVHFDEELMYRGRRSLHVCTRRFPGWTMNKDIWLVLCTPSRKPDCAYLRFELGWREARWHMSWTCPHSSGIPFTYSI